MTSYFRNFLDDTGQLQFCIKNKSEIVHKNVWKVVIPRDVFFMFNDD